MNYQSILELLKNISLHRQWTINTLLNEPIIIQSVVQKNIISKNMAIHWQMKIQMSQFAISMLKQIKSTNNNKSY